MLDFYLKWEYSMQEVGIRYSFVVDALNMLGDFLLGFGGRTNREKMT